MLQNQPFIYIPNSNIFFMELFQFVSIMKIVNFLRLQIRGSTIQSAKYQYVDKRF